MRKVFGGGHDYDGGYDLHQEPEIIQKVQKGWGGVSGGGHDIVGGKEGP